MKREVISILKEKGKSHYFSNERFELIKAVMSHGMGKDPWLKNYLSLDPLNKAQWVADHITSFVETGKI